MRARLRVYSVESGEEVGGRYIHRVSEIIVSRFAEEVVAPEFPFHVRPVSGSHQDSTQSSYFPVDPAGMT